MSVLEKINAKFQVLDVLRLSEYVNSRKFYEKLVSLKKDEYHDNERIVFIHDLKSDAILNNLKKLLVFIDIPDFFTIVVQDEIKKDIDVFEFSDNHCIYPWANIEIRNNGAFSPCCKFSGGILDDNNQPLNIANSTITDAYSSKFMISLREKFKQGQRPVECNNCWINEGSENKSSLRTRANWKFRNILYKIDYETESVDNIRSMDLKLGNTCNLSCRICAPTPSSTIAALDYQANRLSKQQFIKIKKDASWSEDNNFWQQILPLANNLVALDILGGEPLLVKSHFNFLKKLIGLGVSNSIALDYTSNGTQPIKEYLPIWENFLETKISFSIDDIKERFEYQRNGAVWNQVEANIRDALDLRSDKFLVEIYPTINIQNVYYLPELIEWAHKIGVDSISYSFVHTPTYLSVRHMTTEAKTLVVSKLENYKSLHEMIPTSINLILGSDQLCRQENFLKEMQMRDKERGQDFCKTHAKIAKAMGYL
tara:strand:+ start:295 stop:1743 length:1449 start_codon:yes stop_codon:yes gene_type:complete